ncbi:MAG: hypothetical protein IJR95_06995 [Lachnospiraceae bacterium]|nr:hypothetical protein [Lachnospiraceae bacterium]
MATFVLSFLEHESLANVTLHLLCAVSHRTDKGYTTGVQVAPNELI